MFTFLRARIRIYSSTSLPIMYTTAYYTYEGAKIIISLSFGTVSQLHCYMLSIKIAYIIILVSFSPSGYIKQYGTVR